MDGSDKVGRFMENDRGQGFVFLIATWALIIISVYLERQNIFFQWIFWANMVTPMSAHYFVGIVLLMIDVILLGAGTYFFLREGEANFCLLAALLIATFAINVKGNQIVSLLSAYLSIFINFTHYGFGINLAGIGLLVWYLRSIAPPEKFWARSLFRR